MTDKFLMKLIVCLLVTFLLSSLSFGLEPLTQEQLGSLSSADRNQINRIRGYIRQLRDSYLGLEDDLETFNERVEARGLNNAQNPTEAQRNGLLDSSRSARANARQHRESIEQTSELISSKIGEAYRGLLQHSRASHEQRQLIRQELQRLRERTNQITSDHNRLVLRRERLFETNHINLGITVNSRLMTPRQWEAARSSRSQRTIERREAREDQVVIDESDDSREDRSETEPARPREESQTEQFPQTNSFEDLLELSYSHPCRVSYRAVFVMHTSRDTDELRQRRTLQRHVRRLQNLQRPSEAVIGQVIRSIQRVNQKLTEAENSLSQGACDNVPTSKRQIERMSASLRELLNRLIGELLVKAQEMARAGEFPESYRDEVNNFSRRSGGGTLPQASPRSSVDDSGRGGQE